MSDWDWTVPRVHDGTSYDHPDYFETRCGLRLNKLFSKRATHPDEITCRECMEAISPPA